ncbi:MAG: pyridine nucleotide-disulfide oxidoreductase family protein [Mucilaginibacter sp.]|nr:pyridine nucleotide-disulfide oxidoreductase family protein [Mucilaginibacter sp.]
MFNVAVVGAGPSGFYAAGALLRRCPWAEISLIERTPAPYGLVRYGVAPDHPSLKLVTTLYEKIGRDPRVTFFGNTQLWRDLTISEVLATHHAVILATGTPQDRTLGVGDQGVTGLYRASQIVGWYNSDPSHSNFTPRFGAGRVCVFGHGNVAADIARILLAPIERLSGTDISDRALTALQHKPVRDLYLIGRRGPGATRFTPPVIAELVDIPGVEVVIDDPDEQGDDDTQTEISSNVAKDVLEILRGAAQRPRRSLDRRLRIMFRSRPKVIRNDNGLVCVELARDRRSGSDASSILCDAVITATGFGLVGPLWNSLQVIDGALSNRSGQVVDRHGHPISGLYTVGWAARGASGTIGTCRSDAERLVQLILGSASLSTRSATGGHSALTRKLQKNGHHVINFEHWLQIDRVERELGAAAGRPRAKISTAAQMLEAARTFASEN